MQASACGSGCKAETRRLSDVKVLSMNFNSVGDLHPSRHAASAVLVIARWSQSTATTRSLGRPESWSRFPTLVQHLSDSQEEREQTGTGGS